MRIIDVLTSPWAIVPEKLFEIQEIYRTHLRGDKIDIKAIEAIKDQRSEVRDQRSEVGSQRSEVRDQGSESNQKAYQVINDVAVIPIQGVIAKKMNLFTQISGGVSAQLVGNDIKEALADDSIKSILLDIDSPGGTVDGTQELADIVFSGRDKKPIVAYSDGMIASAAYWIASAADMIYISGDTIDIGSIGVVSSHVDYSEYEKQRGVKTTEIYAGKYKRIDSYYKPLTKEGKQYIQDQVDYLYSIFVDQVAKQRGMSSETVLENMADGKIFIGKQSLTAGLVDGVSTIDRLINTILPVMQADREEAKALGELNSRLKVDRL